MLRYLALFILAVSLVGNVGVKSYGREYSREEVIDMAQVKKEKLFFKDGGNYHEIVRYDNDNFFCKGEAMSKNYSRESDGTVGFIYCSALIERIFKESDIDETERANY